MMASLMTAAFLLPITQTGLEIALGLLIGAAIRNRAEDKVEHLAADLVVDATGRGSQAPKWLSALSFVAPDEAQVKVDIGYTTRVYRRDSADQPADRAVA